MRQCDPLFLWCRYCLCHLLHLASQLDRLHLCDLWCRCSLCRRWSPWGRWNPCCRLNQLNLEDPLGLLCLFGQWNLSNLLDPFCRFVRLRLCRR